MTNLKRNQINTKFFYFLINISFYLRDKLVKVVMDISLNSYKIVPDVPVNAFISGDVSYPRVLELDRKSHFFS